MFVHGHELSEGEELSVVFFIIVTVSVTCHSPSHSWDSVVPESKRRYS